MNGFFRSSNPGIYEINTWVWLSELSTRYKRKITLSNVPFEEWDRFTGIGVEAVWLMGVWERSPLGIQIAVDHPGLREEYKNSLADFTKNDVVGSPYSIRQYVVDENLGGKEGLATARRILSENGISLILDYVPNHVALDSPLVTSSPEYLVNGNPDGISSSPKDFFDTGTAIIAHGKDPYFPPWTDTAQLNVFSKGVRSHAVTTLKGIAGQCDGVRCDMAMLVVNHIFKKTWKDRVGAPPKKEFWVEVITAVHETNPEFMFIAEAYWAMEWDLQQMGFNFCYDKRLYDRLVEGNAQGLQMHLQANINFQKKLVRFIENHDEPRALSTFGKQRIRQAALISSTLPGARLIHDGQLAGHKIKLPVQLGRRTEEKGDPSLHLFYTTLLKTVRASAFRNGDWKLCEKSGWASNIDYLNILSWCWRNEESNWLIVVNLSEKSSQGRIFLPWTDFDGDEWLFKDIFTEEEYVRDPKEVIEVGLYVKLDPWGFHLLELGKRDCKKEKMAEENCLRKTGT